MSIVTETEWLLPGASFPFTEQGNRHVFAGTVVACRDDAEATVLYGEHTIAALLVVTGYPGDDMYVVVQASPRMGKPWHTHYAQWLSTLRDALANLESL